MSAHAGKIIVFVDGTCVFCNGLVARILDRDRQDRFHFGYIQSPYARKALERHGHDPEDVDSIYALVDAELPTERLCIDGAAGALRARPLPAVRTLRRVPGADPGGARASRGVTAMVIGSVPSMVIVSVDGTRGCERRRRAVKGASCSHRL